MKPEKPDFVTSITATGIAIGLLAMSVYMFFGESPLFAGNDLRHNVGAWVFMIALNILIDCFVIEVISEDIEDFKTYNCSLNRQ